MPGAVVCPGIVTVNGTRVLASKCSQPSRGSSTRHRAVRTGWHRSVGTASGTPLLDRTRGPAPPPAGQPRRLFRQMDPDSRRPSPERGSSQAQAL